MPSLISQSLQDLVNAKFVDLHDTFKKQITVYKNAKRIAIASSPQFNSIYGTSGPTNTFTTEEVSQTFDARIYYLTMNEAFLSVGQSQSEATQSQAKIVVPNGSIKIVVDPAAYEYIKEARKVEFDGRRFSIKSDGIPIGLFENQYYEFFLTPDTE